MCDTVSHQSYEYMRKHITKGGEVRYHKQKINYEKKNTMKSWTEEQKKKMYELYELGVTKKRICEKFDIHIITLNKCLKNETTRSRAST